MNRDEGSYHLTLEVFVVEKRKKAELEVAAAASRSGVPEQDSWSVRAACEFMYSLACCCYCRAS